MQREKVANPPLTISDSVGVNSRAPRRINTLFWLFMFFSFHHSDPFRVGPSSLKHSVQLCWMTATRFENGGAGKAPRLFNNHARTRRWRRHHLCWGKLYWGWCTKLWYLFLRRRARFLPDSMNARLSESILCSGHPYFFLPFIFRPKQRAQAFQKLISSLSSCLRVIDASGPNFPKNLAWAASD